MKTIIVYTSQTGFTKRYAQWLADKMSGDVFDLSEVQKKEDAFFESYDAIVYAGWCMAGQVVKIKWFLEKAPKWKDKRLAVIAVGGSPNDAPDVEKTLEKLLTDDQKKFVKAFYCQGGIDYDKMKGPSKVTLKMFAAALRRSKDEKLRETGSYVSTSYDISDVKFLEPVVSYLQGETN